MMRCPVGCGQGVRAHENESDGDAAGAFGAVERRTSGEATWKERRCVGVERGSYTHACSGRSNRGSTLYSTDLLCHFHLHVRVLR